MADQADSTVRCRDITGLECSYVAGPDQNVPDARGFVATQVLAALSKHLAYEHPGYALSADMRAEVRSRITW